MHAFSDADWASDKDYHCITTGYIVFLGGNPISWSSKKQKSVSCSSTKAKYKAIANATVELCWLQSLLRELGISFKEPPVVYCDNLGATYLCSNRVFHSKIKHVAADFHFVHEQVMTRSLRVFHVASGDQLADVLTKPLSKQPFSLVGSRLVFASDLQS